MMKLIKQNLVLILLIFSTASVAEVRYSLSFESDSYSDIAPIDQIIKRLKGDEIDDGSIAFTHSEATVSIGWNQWDISLFQRLDYFIDSNADTAYLVWLNNNDVPVSQSRLYDVDIQVNHIFANGLGLSYSKAIGDDIKLKATVNYLNSNQMTKGGIAGDLTTDLSSYQGSLRLDYSYDKDVLLSRVEEPISGQGYSVDIQLQWDISEQWRIDFDGQDLVSEIRWKDVTYTQAIGTSDTISYDEDGTLSSIPILSGIESSRLDVQRLPVRTSSRLQRSIGADEQGLIVGLNTYDNYHFWMVGYSFPVGKLNFETSYHISQQALGFGLNQKNWYINLGLDSVDWEEMSAIKLNFGLRR